MNPYHMIFHLDEVSEQELDDVSEQELNEVINILRNLLADFKVEIVEVELSTNGKGVTATCKDNESHGWR